MAQIKLRTDDEMFMTSELVVKTLGDSSAMEFIHKNQFGYTNRFYVYPDDIKKLIKFLKIEEDE